MSLAFRTSPAKVRSGMAARIDDLLMTAEYGDDDLFVIGWREELGL